MKYRIDYEYKEDATVHKGTYITDTLEDMFIPFMKELYGFNVTFHIEEVK